MGYSQAEGVDIVVYADSLEEAEMKFEDGIYALEEKNEE